MKTLSVMLVGMMVAALGCQDAGSPTIAATNAEPATKITKRPVDQPAEDPGDKEAPRISLDDAKKAFDNGEAVFVDTRGSAFYSNEHVKGAVNVSSSDFESKYKSVPKDKKIIAYCS